MPILVFECTQCHKRFDILTTFDRKEDVKCPDCKSRELKQLITPFSTKGGSGPGSCEMWRNGGCSGCSH